jgi:hypothetical protein
MQQSAIANEYTWTRLPRIDDAGIVIDNSGAGSNAVIIWLRMRGPLGLNLESAIPGRSDRESDLAMARF